jgi:hypothetical protein
MWGCDLVGSWWAWRGLVSWLVGLLVAGMALACGLCGEGKFWFWEVDEWMDGYG